MTNKTKVLSEEKKSREVEELLFNADKAKTDGLFIDKDNDNVVLKDELQKLIELPTDNPDEKYELYYRVIEKTLREKLPKGDEYKEMLCYAKRKIHFLQDTGKGVTAYVVLTVGKHFYLQCRNLSKFCMIGLNAMVVRLTFTKHYSKRISREDIKDQKM